MATTGRIGVIDRLDRRAGRIAGGPREARPEDRIDDHPGALERRGQLAGADVARALEALEVCARVLRELVSGREQQGIDLESHLAQRAGRDQPVPAVVALAADDRRPAGARRLGRRLGDRAAGRLHQLQGGNALLLDRPAIGGPHLVGVEAGIEPLLHRRERTSGGRRAAVLRGDRDSGGGVPRMRQRDGDLGVARHFRRLAMQLQPRGFAADDLDLLRRYSPPQRLDHRLLRRKARRQVAAGTRALAGVGELRGREQPLREPRTALQRALDAVDLDQVDADARGATAAYLRPTTALSSAWSPLAPEPVTR